MLSSYIDYIGINNNNNQGPRRAWGWTQSSCPVSTESAKTSWMLEEKTGPVVVDAYVLID